MLPDAISLNAAAAALERQGCWARGSEDTRRAEPANDSSIQCNTVYDQKVSASLLLAEAQRGADRLLGPEVCQACVGPGVGALKTAARTVAVRDVS